MKACAAGARYATFILFATSFFSLIVGFKLRPSNGAQRTLFCGAKKEKWRRRQKNFKVQPGWCGQQPSSQGYCVLPWFNHGSFPHISPPPEIQIYIYIFFPPKNFRIRFLNLILSTKLIPCVIALRYTRVSVLNVSLSRLYYRRSRRRSSIPSEQLL